MNSNESVGKISLSMLRGKHPYQSVPSISFRFNPGSDDLIKVEDKEDKEELPCAILEVSPEREKPFSADPSPSRREGRGLNQRSSSLDGATTPDAAAPNKTSDSSSLISRLTKTFEHKINEIRSEKQKDSKPMPGRETQDQSNSDSFCILNTDSEKPISNPTRTFESMKRFSLENRDHTDINSSPSKTKTTLVQDITEQKNKLKSDFNKTIRPKITELRNRKSPKDTTNSPKIKHSILQSLLGRDDGILTEELLHECHAVDSAIEAHEDVMDLQEVQKNAPQTLVAKESSSTEEIESTERLSTCANDRERYFKESTINQNFNFKELLIYIVQEIFAPKRSQIIKFALVFFVVCFVLPLPRFLAGFLFGTTLVTLIFLLLLQLMIPLPEETFYQEFDNNKSILKHEDSQLYIGWMNELDSEYYPESYHVSQTHTVLLRLQGSLLQVDNSRKKINKHARPNEVLHFGTFVHHRDYDLTGCEVLLLPKNLPRKWLWSRKYPIFIRLQQKPKRSPSPQSIASTPNRSFHETSSRPDSPEEAVGNSESTDGNWSMDNNHSAVDDDLMSSSLDLGSYEEVTQDMCQETSLCLFARTDREKDDWYRRFVFASERKSTEIKEPTASLPQSSSFTPEAELSIPFDGMITQEIEEEMANEDPDEEGKTRPPTFDQHMACIMHNDLTADPGVSWFNCFVGRILFDFLHDQFWANKIQERVQRKLSKLHIPYFVGEIVVSGIEVGNCVPLILSTERPTMDHRGLWVDLLVEYSGSFRMTLETKLDLMKLKVKSPSGQGSGTTSSFPSSPNDHPSSPQVPPGVRLTRAYARSPSSDCVLRNVQFDADTDDSVESSSEEETLEDEIGERGLVGSVGGGPASKRFLRIVDTVAASRYFQQAAEWKVLQRAMKGVSNTRIELSVEVKRLKGTLALNVPPAPSDRIWYGFRGSPELVMVARPSLGDRQLDTLPFLPDFIQKQLRTVFEKVFVLPNMDDLVIPIMSPLLPGQKNPARPPWDPHRQRENVTPSPKTSPCKTNVSIDINQSFLQLSQLADDP